MAVFQTAGELSFFEQSASLIITNSMVQRTLLIDPVMDPELSLLACQKATTSSAMDMLERLSRRMNYRPLKNGRMVVLQAVNQPGHHQLHGAADIVHRAGIGPRYVYTRISEGMY